MKKFYFLSGLPRSGSTLLSSILNQNPEIHSGPNSPMCGMMFNLERSILLSEQWSAYPKPEVLPKVVMGILENFYSDVEKSIIVDKSREWSIPEHFEVLKRNLGQRPKAILTVRNIVDILASFINLVHRNPSSVSFIDKEIEARQEFNFYKTPDETRCDHLMRPKGLIDNPLYGIAYAIHPENKDFFHIVEYDNLVSDPEKELKKIYSFLGAKYYKHDFENVTNLYPEDDKIYGLNGMHKVRPLVQSKNVDPRAILPESVVQKYSNMEFWRNAK